MNSFKELERINIEDRNIDPEKGKCQINSNHNLFTLLGNVVELYLPSLGSVAMMHDKNFSAIDKTLESKD